MATAVGMNRENTSVASISEADALARALYRRARLAGPDFADIATVVRSLHTVLKHLRVEAEDPDSLLNTTQQEHSVYARQLGPIVEDCDFTLKQLDTILEKYGGSSAGSPVDEHASHSPVAGRSGGSSFAREDGHVVAGTMESREKDMIALIRTKLANQKTNIDIFLDTVQLHNPAKARRFVDNSPSSSQLNAIKDKVAVVAARLAQRRAASASTAAFTSPGSDLEEEELWQQFCTELTKEGFSHDVLMRNKEVLRAYIRELDSNGLLDSDSQPSVRGLLDHSVMTGGASSAPGPPPRGPPMTVTPAPSYPTGHPAAPSGDMSPKEVVYPATENEKFLPSVKLNRRPPEYVNVGPSQPLRGAPLHSHSQSPNVAPSMGQNPSPASQTPGQLQTYNPYHPSNLGRTLNPGQGAGQNQNQNQDQNQMQSYNYPYAPPSPHHLQPPAFHNQNTALSSASGESDSDDSASSDPRLGLALISTRDLMQLDHWEAERLASQMSTMHLAPNMPSQQYISPGTSPSGRYLPAPPTDHVLSSSPSQFGVSPRYVPPLPPPYSSPVPDNNSSMAMVSPSAPPAYGAQQQLARLYSRLQPDSAGNDIPLDAMWTKIRRTLVSPEVLAKAGVRYEARPDFVAVLGVLSREEIAEYARRSAEVRRQRAGFQGKAYPPPRHMRGGNNGHGYRDSKYRSGSTSDSESENLWDESDTSSDEERERRRERRRYRQERERDSKGDKDKKEKEGGDAKDEKGTKVYPFILPLILPKGGSKTGDGKGTPTAASPKPILKNKNENHVRFNKNGPVEITPEEAAAEERRRERRERDRERERDRDRDRAERDRDWDRERDRARERERRRRDREPDRSGDRSDRPSHDHRDRGDRPRDRDHHAGSSRDHHRPSRHHRSHSANGGASSRDRERERRDRKKAWGESLGAGAIGGAAASLLSVLSEAADAF